MLRKSFAFASLLTALSLMIGVPGSAQAPAANSYINDCSWASSVPGTTLLFYIRGHNLAGSVNGCFCASGSTWTSTGLIMGENDYSDSAGMHLNMTASIMFSHYANGKFLDHIPAQAVFQGVVMPDGSQYEGVIITDAQGNMLSSSGVDANGQPQMLKLTKGALIVSH